MISQVPEPDHHRIRPKICTASTLAICMRCDGSWVSGDEQESWGYGLHLGCGGDPKDPSSDWPIHELVMHLEVTSSY